MPRYRLTIEYDGEPFTGWQSQAGGTSIQDVLEKAVSIINGAPSMVYGAGRTDAGVHALGQVAHVDLVKSWDPFKLRNALNGNLRPHPVSVLEAEEVADDFHARFSANRRFYLYRPERVWEKMMFKENWTNIPGTIGQIKRFFIGSKEQLAPAEKVG